MVKNGLLLRLKLKVLKTQRKKDSKTTSELFYTENRYKKQVIVKNDTILKCCKSDHFAKATR